MAKVKIPATHLNDLPPLCIECGRPATTTCSQTFERLTGLTAIVAPVALVFGFLAWHSRQVTLSLPKCKRHASRGWHSLLGFFGGIAVTFGFLWLHEQLPEADQTLRPLAMTATLASFPIGVIAAIFLGYSGIGAAKMTDTSITLNGVHPAFSAEMEQRTGKAKGQSHWIELTTAKYM